MSLIYLLTYLPVLERGIKPKITKRHFFSMAQECLSKTDFHEIYFLLLKEKIDYFIKIKMETLFNKKKVNKKNFLNILIEKEKMHFTNISNVMFPKWIYKDDSPHKIVRLWYHEIDQKSNSYFLKKWSKFSLMLEEVIVGFLSKKNKLSRERFFFQMGSSFNDTACIMKKNYTSDNLGLNGRALRLFFYINSIFILSGQDLEKKINNIRLSEIEKLIPLETFTLDCLIAYYLQLNIYDRECSFSMKKGEKILKDILDVDLGML